MSTPPYSDSIWTRDFLILCAANLLLYFGLQMQIPILPAYVLALGGDQVAVGTMVTAFAVAAVAMRPVSGWALDRFSRQAVIIGGIAIGALAAFAYIPASSLGMILVVRLAQGAGFGLASTGLGTLAADIIPAVRRGEGVGYFGLTTNVAMALGPGLAITLMQRSGFPAAFGASAAVVVASLFAIRIMPRRAPSRVEVAPFGFGSVLEPAALLPASVMLLLGTVVTGMITFIMLFGQEIGVANVGFVFVIYAVTMAAARPVSGRLFDRRGPVWVLLPGTLLMSAAMLALSLSRSAAGLAVGAGLYGVAYGAIQPSLHAWMINRVRPERRGAGTGTLYAAFDIGIGGGAILLGAVARGSTYGGMYRASALLPLGMAAVVLLHLAWERWGPRREWGSSTLP